MDRALKAAFLSRFISQKMTMMLSDPTPENWATMRELLESGKVKPVIDRRYPFTQIADAMRYLEQGHARGKVIVSMDPVAETPPPSSKAPGSALKPAPPAVVLFQLGAFLGGILIAPIIVALVLNRRFKDRNPDKRSYRWGYYFSVMTFVAVLGLSYLLFESLAAVVAVAGVYAVLSWFFAQRQRWAWIALTILSFNPIAWIINAIYLGRRWSEEPGVASAA
jgi:hypothetical protein